MKAHFLRYWESLHSSFWFLPAILAIASAALALSAVAVDERAANILSDWKWLYSGGAEGASAVLQTIAGSMITIAGVVFSMTLVALTLASAQFGPRLLRNFMSDTVNQLVLGTFIATFIYCLLVMRTIRREDDVAFVPHFSVTLGVVLALVSMAVLIYFIHHVSLSIQADEVVARVAKELDQGLDRLFPEGIGKSASPEEGQDEELLAVLQQELRPVEARQDGYLQFMDADELMDLAVKHDLVMQVVERPGQYVTAHRPLILLAPADRASDKVRAAVSRAIIIGSQRTPSQDIQFAISQLVEIAVRALSPGVNDPFTAIRCIDRLGSAIYRLGSRPVPLRYRRDESNRVRIVARPVSFAEILDASLGPIRQNARASAAVMIRLIEVMAVIAEAVNRPEDRAAVLKHARLIADAARTLPEEGDRAVVEERLLAVLQLLNAPS